MTARHDYDTSVRVQAPVETVWRVLTDSAGYRDWNPEILHVDGVMSRDAGTRFAMHLSMTGPLSGLILKSPGDRQPDIDAFSSALGARAESGAAAGHS